jgi:Bacterial HORMA domain family 1
MSSYSYAETFTRAHARRLAGRVTSDLRQSHILYGSPSETWLERYRAELEELLTDGYVHRYQFGFERGEVAVWSLRYAVGPDGSLTSTGTGGGVPTRQNVVGATFFNFLEFSDSWFHLNASARQAVQEKLPFVRTSGTLPSEAGGYWTRDRTYNAGGVALERSVFRSMAA